MQKAGRRGRKAGDDGGGHRSEIAVVALARTVLHAEDNDLLGNFHRRCNRSGMNISALPACEHLRLSGWRPTLGNKREICQAVIGSQNGTASAASRIASADIVGKLGDIINGTPREPQLHRSKRRNAASTSASDLQTGADALALGLPAHPANVPDRLARIGPIACKGKHGPGDLVLAFRRQLLHRLKRLFQELGHSEE